MATAESWWSASVLGHEDGVKQVSLVRGYSRSRDCGVRLEGPGQLDGVWLWALRLGIFWL